MPTRFAFAGFRHGHIMSLYNAVLQREDLEIIAAVEDHAPTRADLAEEVTFTDQTLASFWSRVESEDADVVAIGDYYARRGALAIEAMRRDRHVISDKPVCTTLEELDTIRELALERNLAVGCQLELRGIGTMRTIRRLVHEGVIGEVHTVHVTGQHKLNPAGRPAWYFEPGKHGGTINDIGIHGFDAIPWMTGRSYARVLAARGWNCHCPDHPDFEVGAQFMLELDNGGGVIGDMSYLAPEAGPSAPLQYWRFTLHGDDGYIEAGLAIPKVLVSAKGYEEHPTELDPDEGHPLSYLDDFLLEAGGQPVPMGGLCTDHVLDASEAALITQRAADQRDFDVIIPEREE